jgi:hypothetical protein
MAENLSSAKKPKIAQQLTLRSGVYSVDIKEETNVVFQDKETNEETRAHRSVLSQASPFFNTWFKQWQKGWFFNTWFKQWQKGWFFNTWFKHSLKKKLYPRSTMQLTSYNLTT